MNAKDGRRTTPRGNPSLQKGDPSWGHGQLKSWGSNSDSSKETTALPRAYWLARGIKPQTNDSDKKQRFDSE